MADDYVVTGRDAAAPFTLKIHRGDGMCLLAMDWRAGPPPVDFVGFAIEYREPGGDRFFALKNRLTFPTKSGGVDPTTLSTRLSPIQKFRWIHFPRNAELDGAFSYRVTPVFMNALDELSYGLPQEADIELRRETYPGLLNVTFTRGFVSSQAFADRYESAGKLTTLIPSKSANGLTFKPTHPKTKEALAWMGFEARHAILELLDQAIADGADVSVAAYDLSEPEVVNRLERIGPRLRILIDDAGEHGKPHSGESQAAARLAVSAGAANVRRQHMGSLQHNKIIVVDGPTVKRAVGGSTNFSWRGFYVQANNAVLVTGKDAIAPFKAAFEQYWASDKVADFGASKPALWADLELAGIDGKIAFSPHAADNALLGAIAADIHGSAKSSLFYSLAFLYQTAGPLRDAVSAMTARDDVFVYGISDRKVAGIDVLRADGNPETVRPEALKKNVPAPFSAEPTGGTGNRMHHKFVVIDFDKPTARVYLGSYNFSSPADRKNGENLMLFRDRRIATAYMVEALRLCDHYIFRVAQADARTARKRLQLKRPPRAADEKPWWDRDYTDARKIKDRKLFA